MSWQAYVDTNLLGSGSVTAAGIYDLQGNPWAYSAGFAAQIAEVAAVSGHMHTGDPSGLAGTGVVVAGVKYMYVQGSGDEVYGKKGNEGVAFCKCAHARLSTAQRDDPRASATTRPTPPFLSVTAHRAPLLPPLVAIAQATPASSSPTTMTKSSPARAGLRWPSSPTSSRSRASKRPRYRRGHAFLLSVAPQLAADTQDAQHPRSTVCGYMRDEARGARPPRGHLPAVLRGRGHASASLERQPHKCSLRVGGSVSGRSC